MPQMPPLFGARPRREANRAYDRQRRAVSETRRLYGTGRWKRLRAYHLGLEPFCRMCAARGQATEATVCDHLDPHNGDVERFWSGPFQSLCEPCHNTLKQAAEAAARRGG